MPIKNKIYRGEEQGVKEVVARQAEMAFSFNQRDAYSIQKALKHFTSFLDVSLPAHSAKVAHPHFCWISLPHNTPFFFSMMIGRFLPEICLQLNGFR